MRTRFVAMLFACLAFSAMGASHRTPNFVINAPSQHFAERAGEAAERCRRELALYWLGEELPRWSQPCPVTLEVGPQFGSGGATSFLFDRGEVYGWRMSIQGSEERILDSVLPHEITHTIFASHFRQPLPRWLDEGACTTIEHDSERGKHHRMLLEFLQTNRGISFSDMIRMREYPPDVMPLYAQGYSVVQFLIYQRGSRHFVSFVEDALSQGQVESLKTRYGIESLSEFQDSWMSWVRAGSPVPGAAEQYRALYQPWCESGDCWQWNGGKQRWSPRPQQPRQQQLVPVRPQSPIQPSTQPVAPRPQQPAQPQPPAVDLAPINERLDALTAQIEALANRKPEPGPAGPQGLQGEPGVQGPPGEPGECDPSALRELELAIQRNAAAVESIKREGELFAGRIDAIEKQSREASNRDRELQIGLQRIDQKISQVEKRLSGQLRVRMRFDPATGELTPIE